MDDGPSLRPGPRMAPRRASFEDMRPAAVPVENDPIPVTPRPNSPPPVPRAAGLRPGPSVPLGGEPGLDTFPPAGSMPVDPLRPGPGPPLHPPTPYAYRPPEPFMGGPAAPRRSVSFNFNEGMTRPRDEEERRGEADAGAPPGRRDIK